MPVFNLPLREQSCANCRYGLEGLDDGVTMFECHRHPPAGPDGLWPVILATPWPWCGEWVQLEAGDA
jgi:hypothetical protein